MAEGVLRHLASEAGMNWRIDSAGTGDWHIGEAPDRRAVSTCDKNGIDISQQHARQFKTSDFRNFDLILTMDKSNRDDVGRLAKSDSDKAKIRSLMDYVSLEENTVPDPYYDGRFDQAFKLIWASCSAIVRDNQVSTNA